jgi:hypothetical protein
MANLLGRRAVSSVTEISSVSIIKVDVMNVEDTFRPAVSHSVRLGIEPHLRILIRFQDVKQLRFCRCVRPL